MFANIEIRNATVAGQIKISGAGAPVPQVPTLDYGTNGPYDSGVMIPLSSTGAFTITNASGSPVDLKIDVQGYSLPGEEGGRFTPLPPANAYSTGFNNQIGGGETRAVQIAGSAGVPDDGAAGAVVLSVTAKAWTSSGTITVFDADIEEWPGTTTTSFTSNLGDPDNGIASTTITELSSDGRVLIHNTSANPVAVTLVAQGWFTYPDYQSDLAGVDEYDLTPESAMVTAQSYVPQDLIVHATGANGVTSVIELPASSSEGSGGEVSAQGNGSEPGWRSCFFFSSKQKKLRTYSRLQLNGTGMVDRYATLRCGVQKTGTKSWGYRHIKAGKATAWGNIAIKAGGASWQWEGLASFTIRESLANPMKVSTGKNPGSTWCYTTKLEIYKRDGSFVGSYMPETWIGKAGRKVITSYPTRRGCPGAKLN